MGFKGLSEVSSVDLDQGKYCFRGPLSSFPNSLRALLKSQRGCCGLIFFILVHGRRLGLYDRAPAWIWYCRLIRMKVILLLVKLVFQLHSFRSPNMDHLKSGAGRRSPTMFISVDHSWFHDHPQSVLFSILLLHNQSFHPCSFKCILHHS